MSGFYEYRSVNKNVSYFSEVIVPFWKIFGFMLSQLILLLMKYFIENFTALMTVCLRVDNNG
jgi:hypothetical protein